MFGTWLGIPLAIFVFLAVNHYVFEDWHLVADHLDTRFSIGLLGLLAGIFVLCLCRGIDAYRNEKRDKPSPFDSPKLLPEVLGNVKLTLSESNWGPAFWSFKTVDPESARLVALINFTDTYGFFQPIPYQRCVMLQIEAEPIPEELQAPVPGTLPVENGQTKVRLTWAVDSPLNRYSVNRLQDETTRIIKKTSATPVLAVQEPRERSVFEPPQWVSALLVCALGYNLMLADQYKTARERAQQAQNFQQEQRAEAQRRADLEQSQRAAFDRQNQQAILQAQEEQRRKNDELNKQQQEQQNGSSSTFTPQLGGAGNPNGSTNTSEFNWNTNAPWRR